jgi:phage terminase large subunit-like protein
VIGPLAQANAQVYSAALSREQASLIFSLMAKMVRMNPDLSAHVHIRDSAKELYCTMTGVKFRALSADANTAMGLSPICFCLDEAGQVVGPEYPLYSALHTAQGAHAAPIEFVISTQAANDADFLSQMIDDARTGADARTVCRVYEAPAGCDVLDKDAWRAANPALGTIASEAYVEQLANEAKRLPSRESQFRNLVLNQRVSLRRHLIPMEVWKANGGYPDPRVFEEFPVYGGRTSRRGWT